MYIPFKENKSNGLLVLFCFLDLVLLICPLTGFSVIPATLGFFLLPFWIIPFGVYLNSALILSCTKDKKDWLIKLLIGLIGLVLFVVSVYSTYWLMDAADFAPNSTFIPVMQNIGSIAFLFTILLPVEYIAIRLLEIKSKNIFSFRLFKNDFLNIIVYLIVIFILPIVLSSIPNYFPHPMP